MGHYFQTNNPPRFLIHSRKMAAFQSEARRLPTPVDDSFKDDIVPTHVEEDEFFKYSQMWREYAVLDPSSYVK